MTGTPDEAARSAPESAALAAPELRGWRLHGIDLGESVLRSAEVDGAEIDAPWLLDGEGSLIVNGVDVAPLIDAELNRRFPGRSRRGAHSPQALRDAWSAVESAWAAAEQRAARMPADVVDRSVDGEWSFAQTLRHLVMAIDTWLGRGILELPQPYHPLGQPNAEYAEDGYDTTVFSDETPTYGQVLQARADRQRMVRDYLATVTDADLDATRPHPWGPEHRVTVRHCLHTILHEEWEHLRFAQRDLDALDPDGGAAAPVVGVEDGLVNLYTSDLPRALAFYQGALGLRETFRAPLDSPDHVELAAGPMTIALSTTEAARRHQGIEATPGARAMCLVLWVRDLDAVTSAALAGGATLVAAAQDSGNDNRTARVQDPDGNLVEFVTKSS